MGEPPILKFSFILSRKTLQRLKKYISISKANVYFCFKIVDSRDSFGWVSEWGGKTRGKPNFFCFFFVSMFVLFLKEFCQYHFSKNIFCTRNKYLLFSFNAQLKLNPGIPQLPKEEICLLKCLLSVKVELEPGSWFGRFKVRFFSPKFSYTFH